MDFLPIDIINAKKDFRANLINSITGFKSIALVGTINAAGKTNLCPISQIIHVGAHPPLIGLLFRPHTVPRHTLENILDQKEFTINHIREEFITQAHHTAARWDESEFSACGFDEEYKEAFKAPFVKQSTIQLGCVLNERLDIQSNGTHFIVAAIERIHVPNEVVGSDGFIDLEHAGSLTCSGLDSYHRTQKVARLSYAKPDHQPLEL